MRYVCDAPGGKTWFRIETEAEATTESDGMRHAVEKFFRKEQEKATQSFQPASTVYFEQEIGLKAHVQREMPLFLTLRDDEGNPLATAMLPPGGRDDRAFRRSRRCHPCPWPTLRPRPRARPLLSLPPRLNDPGPARDIAGPEGGPGQALWNTRVLSSMLSRGKTSEGAVGSSKAEWAVKRAVPSSAE